MTEKIRGKRGGARPGSGRKPIKVEDNVKAAIMQAVAKDPERVTRIWDKVLEKAEKGSYLHQQLFFNYYYGRPKENIEVSTKQLILTRHIING